MSEKRWFIHIVPDHSVELDGMVFDWKVVEAETGKVLYRSLTKLEACAYATRRARQHWKRQHLPSQISIHDRMGRFQRDHTIPRSTDPVTSPG